MGLSEKDRQILETELLAIEHRTYLWVYLIFDVIEGDSTIFTEADFRENIRKLPKTVEAAYDKILRRSCHVERARKLLHIVVAADRPLSLKEMAIALAIAENHRSYGDLENELLSPDVLRRTIREACGLFVTVKASMVYLIHQTAREFLIQPLSSQSANSVQPFLKWEHSLAQRNQTNFSQKSVSGTFS